ncbi:MAG: hypothetical protein OXG43_11725 [Chloroflexi bacterium]|nr:hypothetical protein [Chloroflexota bacterium]
MKRRLQLFGLVAVPLGAIAFGAVALLLVAGLQQELADATARVDRLEAAAAALEPRVLALEDAPTPLDAVQPVLSAQRFRLVDASGQERAVLQMEEAGPSLRVLGGGETQVFIGVTDTGPELAVNGPGLAASSARATLKLNANGLPHLEMVDLEGRPRTALALSSASGNGDGFLRFWDQDGDRRLLVGVRDDASEVVLADGEDIPRAKLSAGPTGPILRLHDAAGNARGDFGLTNLDQVGVILRGDDEEQRAAFMVNPYETSLSFFGPRGQVRSVLESDDEGSSLFLFDAQDSFSVSLGVSDDGSVMGFSDETGTIRAALGFVGPGPTLEFADAEGTVRAHLSDTADATRLVLQDEQGIPRTALGITGEGVVLGLFDESGTLRTSVGQTPEGSAFEVYDAQGTVRASLGISQGSPALSLNDSSQSPRVFAGFVRSTQEPFIATLDDDLGVIWRSDRPPDSESDSETTANAGG